MQPSTIKGIRQDPQEASDIAVVEAPDELVNSFVTMPVSSFTEDDIPQVADLYWSVLREQRGPAPVSVQSFLRELYFTNPWISSSFPSLVYKERGRIVGFLGVVPRRMSFRGQSLSVAFGGNFVVRPDFRNTLAGLHLLRTYLAGNQDLSQTDSANNKSRALLERLGFTTILPLSIHWVRLLRPARTTTYALSRFLGTTLSTCVELVSRPFCSVLDGLALKLPFNPLQLAESNLFATDLDIETLLGCLREYRSGYSLWHDYDAPSLRWLLNFMERMHGHGRELRRVALRDDRQNITGWYIYYRTPGGIGEVVQVGGARPSIKKVLDHLFRDAWDHGVIALHGIADSRLMGEFSEKNCIFTCRGGWMVAHSRKREVIEILNRGDAFLSRLDGEWCLAHGG